MSRVDLEAAIVADDLTGALDMAAPFASRGFATRLLLDHAKAAAVGTQVLTLTSASRDLPREAASKNIRAAMEAALLLQPKILIKKIDSTLRGDVGHAILTAMQISGRRHALIAPAVPGHGRTMRGGEVFLNGVSLREKPRLFDGLPLPAPAPLPELLRVSSAEITVHGWRRGETAPLGIAEGRHAYVADAETDDDLDRLARFAHLHAGELLVVGASGLGAAIARQLAQPPVIEAATRPRGEPGAAILFVIGSRTPVSAEQIARLSDRGAREIVLPFPAPKREDADAVEADFPGDGEARIMVLRPTLSLQLESSSEIAAHLGQAAARLLRRYDLGTIVMSGGDTALAVFRALGVTDAVLRRELSPGVATGTVQLDGSPLTFVTKSGGFGDRDALIKIAQALRAK
jgi:uncharacterized protein YgbK (DUF1537 family)